MNNPKLSNIRINRNGVLVFHWWYRDENEVIDGLSIASVFDTINEKRVNDLIKPPWGSRYINFTALRNG